MINIVGFTFIFVIWVAVIAKSVLNDLRKVELIMAVFGTVAIITILIIVEVL